MSRNLVFGLFTPLELVTSREGRVSRNGEPLPWLPPKEVTSREGRVSRNSENVDRIKAWLSHVPRGACE